MIFVVLFLTVIFIVVSIFQYKKVFNPFTLLVEYPLLFLLIPQILKIFVGIGNDFFFSDIIILIHIISLWIGTSIKLVPIKITNIQYFKIPTFLYYYITIIAFIPLLPILLKYGLSLKGIRKFYEIVVFSEYASIYAFFKTSLIILMILTLKKSKKVSFLLVFLFSISFFSGSKSAILTPLIILCTMYEEYRKINYSRLILFLFISFIIILLYQYFQTDGTTLFNSAISYFDIYDQQSKAIKMLHNRELEFFYGKISFTSIYRIIPRIIWQNKPFDYSFALLNYAIYPQFSQNGYMPSFGLGYAYADFGVFSIFFSAFFMGLAKNYFYRTYKKTNNFTFYLLFLLGFDSISFLILCYFYFFNSIKPYKGDIKI